METLAYIKELILLNDCVVIPGFGGFIIDEKAAKIEGSALYPPTSTVSFNSKLKFNDGLLINHIALDQNLSFVQAKKVVKALVSEINYRLADGEEIKIPELGTLKYDDNHSLVFKPLDNINLNVESYGLPPFKYESLFSKRVSQTIERTKTDMMIAPKPERKLNLRRSAWIAPVLIALIALPLANEIPHSQKANILSFFEQTDAEENNKLTNDVLEQAATTTGTAGEDISFSQLPNPKPYHVIAGSFKDELNAQKLFNQLQAEGLAPINIGQINNLYYIAAGSYSSLDEAKLAKDNINTSHKTIKGAWVYKEGL